VNNQLSIPTVSKDQTDSSKAATDIIVSVPVTTEQDATKKKKKKLTTLTHQEIAILLDK